MHSLLPPTKNPWRPRKTDNGPMTDLPGPRRSGSWPLWIALLCTFGLWACQEATIPAQLKGRWVADDARHQNCYFEITADHITFGGADLDANTGKIRKIRVKTKDRIQITTIDYVDLDGVSHSVELNYSSGRDDFLWFKNQPDVKWQRFKGAAGTNHD
jgi:hypothetical protein